MLDLKFFDWKTNMLILSGLREDLIGVTMIPAALNTRSDSVLVEQMHFKQPWPGILPHYYTTKQAGLHWPSLSLRRHTHGTLAKRLMHIAHLAGNTSGVSKLFSDWLNYTGFPGDVCVAFFNVPPGNKDAVAPNPLTKEESSRVYNCDNERLSGSTKRWIFKSMWTFLSLRHRIFKICPRVLHTGLLLWRHFHAPKRDTKRNVIGCFTCQSYGLLGGPWPFKAAKVPRPSAVSLKVWLRETITGLLLQIASGNGSWDIKCSPI